MNAYDACSQIWLLGVGRSMVSSKLARGRLGLRSAAALITSKMKCGGRCSIYFTYLHLFQLNGNHTFCWFFLSGSSLVLHFEQGTAALRARAAYLRSVDGHWKGLLIEDRNPNSPSSLIGFGEVTWNYSGHGVCLSDVGRLCLNSERQQQFLYPGLFWIVFKIIEEDDRACVCLMVIPLPHILKTMHFQDIWLVHLIWPFTHEPLISNEDGPDRSKDLTRGSHGQNCGPSLQKYGSARHGPTPRQDVHGRYAQCLWWNFFQCTALTWIVTEIYIERERERDENSGVIRGITTQNCHPLSGLTRLDTEAIWSRIFATMFATLSISMVLLGSDVHRCLFAASGGRNRLRLKTAHVRRQQGKPSRCDWTPLAWLGGSTIGQFID